MFTERLPMPGTVLGSSRVISSSGLTERFISLTPFSGEETECSGSLPEIPLLRLGEARCSSGQAHCPARARPSLHHACPLGRAQDHVQGRPVGGVGGHTEEAAASLACGLPAVFQLLRQRVVPGDAYLSPPCCPQGRGSLVPRPLLWVLGGCW